MNEAHDDERDDLKMILLNRIPVAPADGSGKTYNRTTGLTKHGDITKEYSQCVFKV